MIRKTTVWTGIVLGLLLVAGTALAQGGTPQVIQDQGLRAVAEGSDLPLSYRPLANHPAPGMEGITPVALPEYVRPTEFGVIFEYDGSRAQLEAAGIRVQTQAGKYFTARVKASEITSLYAVAGIRNARLERFTRKHLNASVADANGNLLHGIPTGTPPVYPGEIGVGAIIGDVDSGIDKSNPEFKDPVTGLTRILYIWDEVATGTPPSGFSYGTEWTAAQINAGTCAEADSDGHGTNCAGAMVGNGANTGCSQAAYRYVGVAPGANFIEVKTTFTDAAIADGVNYIFQKAAALGKDAVVNLSLGSPFGPHDGSDDFSQAINALTGPGKIVVASAGNDNGTAAQYGAQHGKLVTSATQDTFTVLVPTYTAYSGAGNDFFVITGWYDPSVSLTIKVMGPSAADTLSCGFGGWSQRTFTAASSKGGTCYIANNNASEGFGGTATLRQFEIEVWDATASNAPRNGSWRILPITNGGSPTGKRVDIWIYSQNIGNPSVGKWAYVNRNVDYTTLVGSPACADSVIAVGAYSTKLTVPHCGGGSAVYSGNSLYGAAYFSSAGPRNRDNMQKPELSAPGYMVSMTHSSTLGALAAANADDDGVHEQNAGTSFAAPHVAAATAMWMKYRKHATPSLARLALEQNARVDGYTGAVPNNMYGYGKLDMWKLFDHKAPSIAVTSPAGGEAWNVGSVHNITWTATDSVGVDSVKLEYSLNGGSSWIPVAANLPNTGSYAWTVPAPSTNNALVRATAVDVFLNRGSAQSPALFNINTLTPVQMSGLVAEANHGYVDVKWSAFIDGAAKFQVVRSTSRDAGYAPVSGVLEGKGTDYAFRDVDAQPGTEYFYKVAYGTPGQWSYTSALKVVTPAAVFAIRGVTPNPSSGTTHIRYEIARAGRATVEVYNLAGQKVRTLLDGVAQPGVASLTWDGRTEAGRRVAGGAYFVRVTSQGRALTKQVMLVQ